MWIMNVLITNSGEINKFCLMDINKHKVCHFNYVCHFGAISTALKWLPMFKWLLIFFSFLAGKARKFGNKHQIGQYIF